MRVLVTRPLEDALQTATMLREMGHEPLLAPLLTTRFFDVPAPALDGVQAILATSANGVRALAKCLRSASPARGALAGEVVVAGPRASEDRRGFNIPLFAVGPQTAEAATAAGFATVRNAQGDARALAEATARWTKPEQGALLHVCGEDAPANLARMVEAKGFSVRGVALYRVDAAPRLPEAAALALARREVDAALFFSPRSAGVFARLAAAANLPVDGVTAACISTATAAALSGDFAEIRIAAQPNQEALLACLSPGRIRENP